MIVEMSIVLICYPLNIPSTFSRAILTYLCEEFSGEKYYPKDSKESCNDLLYFPQWINKLLNIIYIFSLLLF